jgi:hypothetical protein
LFGGWYMVDGGWNLGTKPAPDFHPPSTIYHPPKSACLTYKVPQCPFKQLVNIDPSVLLPTIGFGIIFIFIIDKKTALWALLNSISFW